MVSHGSTFETPLRRPRDKPTLGRTLLLYTETASAVCANIIHDLGFKKSNIFSLFLQYLTLRRLVLLNIVFRFVVKISVYIKISDSCCFLFVSFIMTIQTIIENLFILITFFSKQKISVRRKYSKCLKKFVFVLF